MNFWRVTCGNPNQGKKGPCCYAWTACDVRGRDNWNSTRNSIDPIDPVKGQFQTRPHPEAVTSKALSIFDPNPTNQKVGSSNLSGLTKDLPLTHIAAICRMSVNCPCSRVSLNSIYRSFDSRLVILSGSWAGALTPVVRKNYIPSRFTPSVR